MRNQTSDLRISQSDALPLAEPQRLYGEQGPL